MKLRQALAALLSGLVFGLGLAIAGMTDPRKVLGFLDLAGDWDPSLLLVLGSAVIVAALGYHWVRCKPAPLFDQQFWLPENTRIDTPLVVGALLFGVGWGIAGYCPGPAIATLAYANRELLVFLPALLLGQWLHRLTRRS